MLRHILQTALPVVNVEIGVSKPSVSVSATTAPRAFRHVVVQMNVDALFVQFGGDGIENL